MLWCNEIWETWGKCSLLIGKKISINALISDEKTSAFKNRTKVLCPKSIENLTVLEYKFDQLRGGERGCVVWKCSLQKCNGSITAESPVSRLWDLKIMPSGYRHPYPGWDTGDVSPLSVQTDVPPPNPTPFSRTQYIFPPQFFICNDGT